MLNRYATLPLYRQLSDDLERRLGQQYAPGDRLPSEAQLAADYAVNRLTVRQAMADLARRGLVTASRGRGTFVAHPPVRYEISPGRDASFSRAMRARGHDVTLRLLRSGSDEDPEVMRQLQTTRPVRRFHLLRSLDAVPWSLTTTWLSAARFRDLDRHWNGSNSLFEVLERHYGVRTVRASRRFTAIPADAVDAKHLTVSIGAPVLQVRGLNTSEDGDPIAFVEHHFRGDRVQFTVDLG